MNEQPDPPADVDDDPFAMLDAVYDFQALGSEAHLMVMTDILRDSGAEVVWPFCALHNAQRPCACDYVDVSP